MSRTKLIFKNFKIIGKPVGEIEMGQWFTGNPKVPCSELPYYSGAIGDGLYIKSVNGIFSVCGSTYWPLNNEYIIESYVPIDAVKIVLKKNL